MVLTIDSHEKEDFYIEDEVIKDPNLYYKDYIPNPTDLIISRSDYANKLYGFWLGQCIANWTGLVTEMDKICNIGVIKTGEFYTREDWGKTDQPNIWSNGNPSDLSPTIDFVFVDENGTWGSDDDTDIEYMYQEARNNFINKISTCFLKEVGVTYGGDRFTAHRPTEGLHGYGAPPTRTTLALTFQEMEILTRQRIDEGF